MKNWLPIRQDYLIDNFESLLEYLTEADYDNIKDGLLIESVERLHEVASDLLEKYFSHKLGIRNNEDEDFVKNVRIVLASIYASIKMDHTPSELIASLFDTLVVNQLYQDEDSLYKIKNIFMQLARHNPIQTLPYSLKELAQQTFDLHLFVQQLCGVVFATDNVAPVGFESRGSCLFESGEIKINPIGLLQLGDRKLKTVSLMNLDVSLRDEGKTKVDDLDFKERVTYINRLVQSMEKIHSTSARHPKVYSENQEFYVKVSEVNPVRKFIKCHTLDPDYQRLELYLYLPSKLYLNTYTYSYPNVVITWEHFIEFLKPDNILKVCIVDKDGKRWFSIKEPFLDYYSNIENFSGYYRAIFMAFYPGGTRWLTDIGHTVNILDMREDVEIKEAESVECNLAIDVTYANRVEDNKGNLVINALRSGNLIEDVDHAEFARQIPEYILDELIYKWREECPVYEEREESIPTVDPIYVRGIGHLLAVLGDDMSMPFYTRYANISGAKILALMVGDDHDARYCEFSLAYLRAIWAFLQDSGHDWLHPLQPEAQLAGLEPVELKRLAINTLCEYKEVGYAPLERKGNDIDVERLHKLVNASNALTGNIAESEINRVKRTIAQCLGAVELFKEEASDRYCFGEESEMLEFKTSVVYPPSKNGPSTAEPNVQIWNILRTVNGFLNSLHGGTLLIGVNDFGYAVGVDSDIEWLESKGLLLVNNVDRYIQYVKLRVDHAFQAYRREDSDTDITSTRVRYSSFPIEGKNIVRVDVMPYEMGCVKIKEKIGWKGATDIRRPGNVKEAYIRNATTTEELTPTVRQKLEGEKRMVIKDGEERKHIIIQEAIESKRLVTLKGYKSKSRECDRVVEPIELLPLRRLVVGIEKGKKELRVFKLSRCEEVVMAEEKLKRSSYNGRAYKVDPFNMLYEGGKGAFNLTLLLDRMGWLLLQERYPYAAGEIESSSSDTAYPYTLKCKISDVRGVGSFCMSILGHFKIVNCPPLEHYIDETYAAYRKNS